MLKGEGGGEGGWFEGITLLMFSKEDILLLWEADGGFFLVLSHRCR